MPYQQNYGVFPPNMPRVNRLPLTPPEIWGTSNIQQNYGAIGQSYYHQQDHYNTTATKRLTQYEYDWPPLSAHQHAQYDHFRSSDYRRYDSQIPILAPIRTHDLERPIRRIQEPIPDAAEEKVAGGVASTLTYKMEHMVDYVSQMTTAMYHLYNDGCIFAGIDIPLTVQSNRVEVAPAFRKYVSQVLSSTRLPISTIMLSLHYMVLRIEQLQEVSQMPRLQASLTQMLTTSLMLASKFLDDNTFQNKSWAEVSNTPVKELNRHELAWLTDMGWHLQFDVDGDFSHWMECYERSAETKKMRSMQSSMEALKVSQDFLRQPQPTRYLPQTPLYTPPSAHHEQSFVQHQQHQQQQPGPRPDPWSWNPMKSLSPPSAGPSYPSTPADWFKNPSTGFGQHSMAYSSRPLPPLQILPSNQSPYYGHNYSQYNSTWSGHSINCRCCYGSVEYNSRSCAPHHFGVSSAA